MRAVLLAGGGGRRAGGPKAHIDVGGTPLWRVVADRLAARFPDLVVAVGPEPWDTTPYEGVGDQGRGPLDGISAASTGDDLVVWTVDVPDVEPSELEELARPSTVVRHLVDETGRPQPLLARWPAAAIADIPAYLDHGGRSVLGFLDRHDHAAVGRPRSRTHLTTPRDVERWLGSV
jgi:molybdopterin-guanine dinucleotide biosynthesis protein A